MGRVVSTLCGKFNIKLQGCDIMKKIVNINDKTILFVVANALMELYNHGVTRLHIDRESELQTLCETLHSIGIHFDLENLKDICVEITVKK